MVEASARRRQPPAEVPVCAPAALGDTGGMIELDASDGDDMDALLGAEGPFARELPNFAPRQAQQVMATAVQRAIAGRETLVAEAGTGTGKTYAYLVPALLSGERVIISTGTKALQDQLFFRDLPRVRSVLGSRQKTALLKGRANYLCLYRLDQCVREGAAWEHAQAAQLASIRALYGARTPARRAGSALPPAGRCAIMEQIGSYYRTL